MRTAKHKFEIRKQRVRKKIAWVSDRPRLTVFKSGRHFYAQIIDDSISRTMVSASTLDKGIRKPNKSNCNKETVIKVAELLAKRAEEIGINKVVFDKGGNKYPGVLKVFADVVRTELEF